MFYFRSDETHSRTALSKIQKLEETGESIRGEKQTKPEFVAMNTS